jgi:hypothetical protein
MSTINRTRAVSGRSRSVFPATRVILVLFAMLTVLATNQLFVLARYTDQWFAWTIQPPLTAAFLGSGYGAGCVLVVLAVRTRLWAQARTAIVTIALFAALTLIATLLHLDRFHFAAPGAVARFAAWFWLAVYVVVPLALLVLAVQQQRAPGGDPVRVQPMPAWLMVLLAAQGAIMLSVGAALFLDPRLSAALWPWTLTPLTARMVAAWLVAFGFAAAMVLVERDLQRLRIDTVGYTVFGVLHLLALVIYGRADVRWGTTAATVYLIVLCSVPLVGIAGWWLTARGGRLTDPVDEEVAR